MDRIRSWSGLIGAGLFLVGGIGSLVVQKLSIVWILLAAAGLVLAVWSQWAAGKGGGPRSALLGRQGMNATASALLVVAIVGMTDAIATHHSKHIDLTR